MSKPKADALALLVEIRALIAQVPPVARIAAPDLVKRAQAIEQKAEALARSLE